VGVRTRDDDVVVLGLGTLFQFGDHGGEEGIRQVGDEDRDDPGLTAAQLRRRAIGDVAEGACGLADAVRDFPRRSVPSQHDVGHGGSGHAGADRHVLDGCPFDRQAFGSLESDADTASLERFSKTIKSYPGAVSGYLLGFNREERIGRARGRGHRRGTGYRSHCAWAPREFGAGIVIADIDLAVSGEKGGPPGR